MARRLSAPILVRPDSKCRNPLALNVDDNASPRDSNPAMAQHHRPHEPVATKALPPVVASLMQPFQEFFTAPVWRHLLVLIAGMVLSPGKRTVSAALRVMGHLGVETQRQWSDLAIARTTLALFGIFSLLTLWAADPKIAPNLRPRSAAWYDKTQPTFSDVVAAVRKQFWAAPNLSISRTDPDSVEIPLELWNRLSETLAFAA
jgi:hypothetical protein